MDEIIYKKQEREAYNGTARVKITEMREQNSIPMDILIFSKTEIFFSTLLPTSNPKKNFTNFFSLSISISMKIPRKAPSNWLCIRSSKSMFVKIVHPGGHFELHDRPILAAEMMLQNPKCSVAHPHVFQQPWATVEPDTMLMLAQKFYVVPMSTLRKLQRFSLKYSPINHHLQSSSCRNQLEEPDQKTSGDIKENYKKDVEKDGFFYGVKCCLFFGCQRGGNGDDLMSFNGVGSYDEKKRLVVSKRTRRSVCSSRNGKEGVIIRSLHLLIRVGSLV